jgi:hypothetical protein
VRGREASIPIRRWYTLVRERRQPTLRVVLSHPRRVLALTGRFASAILGLFRPASWEMRGFMTEDAVAVD